MPTNLLPSGGPQPFNLAPIFNGWQGFDTNGKPLNGGKIWTYTAATTTPAATYTTAVGNVQNANPIILGTDGRPPSEIWLPSGAAYKFVLQDSQGNTIPGGTYDSLIGINDVSLTTNEWLSAGSVTFLNGTQFTVTGDQTLILHIGRRVKATVTAGTIYGRISATAFTTLTTVTVVWDSGALDAGLSALSYGIISAVNTSAPQGDYNVNNLTIRGALNEAAEVSVATAATCNIFAAASSNILLTGVVTVSAFDTASAGIVRTCRAQSAFTITYNATSLITPWKQDLLINAGDCFQVESLGSGNSIIRFPNAFGMSSVINRDVTQADVTNTVTETAVYTYSVPGGLLGTTRAIRLTVLGDYLNNTVGAANVTFRVKYGATTLATMVHVAVPNVATRYPVHMTTELSATNATNSQVAETIGNDLPSMGGANVDGTGSVTTIIRISAHSSVAEDSTAAKNLVVTVQHGTASASISFHCNAVQLELI